MALKLRLAPGEKLVVNGSIIRNNGRSRIDIEVENRSDVLRASEMLDAASADTPVKRACYMLQVALVSKAHRDDALARARMLLGDLRAALGRSHGPAFDRIEGLLDAGEFYRAERELRALVPFEEMLLSLAAKARAA